MLHDVVVCSRIVGDYENKSKLSSQTQNRVPRNPSVFASATERLILAYGAHRSCFCFVCVFPRHRVVIVAICLLQPLFATIQYILALYHRPYAYI